MGKSRSNALGHAISPWIPRPDKKNILVPYVFIRNPYMKFQDPSMHGSKVTGGIKTCDIRTLNVHTDKPHQLFQSWEWGGGAGVGAIIRASICKTLCSQHMFTPKIGQDNSKGI